MSGHAERTHRRFSPSQAERFRACNGSTNLLKRVPPMPPTEWSIEGTKAHTVLEAALRHRVRRAKEAHEDYSELCCEELNTVNNHFYYSIQVALNHVYAILDEHPDAVMWIEQYVDPPVSSAPGEAGGYCDIVIYVPSTRTLYVIDYKHGAGITKAVKDNKQVMQYANGVLFQDNPLVDPDDVDTVVLTIMQPRAFHPDGAVREYEVTPGELYADLMQLDEDIAANLKPTATLVPDDNGKTTDHCRFCDAKTICPAREAAAVKAVGAMYKSIPEIKRPDLPVAATLDIDRLAYISFHAPMLRKFLDDVDNHIEQLIRNGYHVPGKKLVEVNAQRRWYGEPDDVAKKVAALAGVPIDDVMEKRIIPITSAEKLIVEAFKRRAGRGKKNKAAEDARQAFAFLTIKQSSGNLTVVDDDDPRPPINRASTNFAQISGNVLPPPSTLQEKQ